MSKDGWGGMESTGEAGPARILMFCVEDKAGCQLGAAILYDLDGGVGDDDNMFLDGEPGSRREEGVHGMSTLSFDGELGREPQFGVGECPIPKKELEFPREKGPSA